MTQVSIAGGEQQQRDRDRGRGERGGQQLVPTRRARLAIDQAASGRKSANSSGSACGSSATSSTNGRDAELEAMPAALLPSA